jgi:hypothetical protein
MEEEEGEMQSNSKILVTGESIVKEHREEMLRRANNRFRGVGNEKPLLRKPSPEERIHFLVSPPPRPVFFVRLTQAVNWPRVFDYVCWAAAILAIAAISGVMFFGPISWREFWR